MQGAMGIGQWALGNGQLAITPWWWTKHTYFIGFCFCLGFLGLSESKPVCTFSTFDKFRNEMLDKTRFNLPLPLSTRVAQIAKYDQLAGEGRGALSPIATWSCRIGWVLASWSGLIPNPNPKLCGGRLHSATNADYPGALQTAPKV